MYKHMVVGVRREPSWRSDDSEHIVGICTLDAVDEDGRFADLDPRARWKVTNGKIEVVQPEPQAGNGAAGTFSLRCRHWALEEVVGALAQRDAKGRRRHEFYTVEPREDGDLPGSWEEASAESPTERAKRAKVYSYRGADGQWWISTRGDGTTKNNLAEQPLRHCLPGGCALVLKSRGEVSRWEGPYL